MSFEEAETALDDPLLMESLDEGHSSREERWRSLGRSILGRLLVVIWTERGDRMRIISARLATREERDDHQSRR